MSPIPGILQIGKILKDRSSNSVSQYGWLFNAFGNASFLFYALMLGDIPVFITSALPLVAAIGVLICTVIYPPNTDYFRVPLK